MLRHLSGLLLATALVLSGCGNEHAQDSFLGRVHQALGAPTLTTVTPNSGGPGTYVNINGANFTGTTVVRFNGVATTFFVGSDTDLWSVRVPEGATTGRISITNASGTTTSAADFTVPALAEVTGFSPQAGGPGTQVVLTGRGLGNTTGVSLGGVGATFTVNSDTQVTATVPVGAMTGSVFLQGAGGSVNPDGTFTVLSSAAPTITGFSPASLTPNSSLVVTGTNFTGVTAVSIDGAVADWVNVRSDTELEISVPAGAATGRIRVYNTRGSAVSASNLVVLTPPKVTGFSPASGAPGTVVTITGSGFTGATGVRIGGLAAASFTVVNDTQVTATVASGAILGTVRVTTPGGSGTSTARFAVQSAAAPTLTSFAPTSGLPSHTITLTGTGFTGTTEVTFNGVAAGIAASSDTSLSAIVPEGATTGPVRLTNTRGTVVSSTSFTVSPSTSGLSITGFSPTSGAMGTLVTVTGKGFTDAWSVGVGSGGTAPTVVSDTQLTFLVGPGMTSGSISVSGPSGWASSSGTFTVTGSAVPVISGFSPGSGGALGGQVYIRGANFTGATEVSFNGVPAPYFYLQSDGQIQVSLPYNATTGRIRVTNSQGTGTSSTDFIVRPLAAIASFSPASGAVGSQVTLTGTGFVGTSRVYVGDVSAVFQVNSDTQLTVTVPPGAPSARIAVVTAAGYSYSNGDFTVQASAAPSVTRFSPAAAGSGAQVNIYGAGFAGVTEVLFNGVRAYATARGDGHLVTYVPDSATTGNIEVKNALGTGTSSTAFTVLPPPIITAMSPASGTAGTTVTFTGTGFIGTSYVCFNNGCTSNFMVVSDTQMTAVVPSGATSGKVRIQGSGGNGTSTTAFTVQSTCAPTLTGFSPASAGRYNSVTVTGTCFTGLTRVSFNGVDADGFYVSDDTRVDVSVPGGATTGKLSVTNTLGTAQSTGTFTVLPPPTITAISPSSAKAGATVTLTGTGFTGTTNLTFPRNLDAVFSVVSDTQMTAVVPLGATSGLLSIGAPGGFNNSSVRFTVLSSVAPTVTAFTPARGGVSTFVELTGSGFTGTTRVTFNGLPATTVQVIGDTSLRARVPVGASSGRISVINTVGSATTASDFTVLPPPTVASFTPARGGVGTQVTLTGSGFTGADEVSLNGRSVDFTVVDDGTLKVTIPVGVSTGPFQVSAPGGIGASEGHFTVLSSVGPNITGLSPATGGPGTWVRLTGSGFTGTTAVSFNGAAASEFSVETDTILHALAPPAATTGRVTVFNTVGSATSAVTFTVMPAPVISGFSPASGALGTPVTLTGSGFTGATGVFFNGQGGGFTVVSDTQIAVPVPEGATTGVLTVEGPGGAGSSSTNFTVSGNRLPTVTSFNPVRGARNNFVTIAGSGFTGTTAVRFNGVAATTVFVGSDFSLQAAVPRGATTGPISVTNSVGTGTSADVFTIVPIPTVTGFTPDRGGAGTTVTVTGTGFTDTNGVFFADTAATYEVLSDTQLTVIVPVGATSAAIRVRSPGGSGYATTRFTVLASAAPTLTGFVPASGGEGRAVQLSGTNFTGVTGVFFNGAPAAEYVVNSETLITATVPRGATTGRVSVTNTAGTALSASNFTVVPAATLASFSPSNGGVGTQVTLTGSGFTGATAVRFNGRSADFTVTNDTQLRATVPFGAVSGAIEVVTPGGTIRSATEFVVPSAAAPTVASFTPSQGGSGIGFEVTVIGTNFSGAVSVRFNNAYAEHFRVVSDSELVAVVPVGATTGRITVTNNVGTGFSTGNFTVLPPPSIDSFAPAEGQPGTTVTLTGANFTGATEVRFGARQRGSFRASSFTVVNATRIDAVVPVGLMSGPIEVRTPGGVAVSKTDFSVQSPLKPTVDEFSPSGGQVGALVSIAGFGLTGVTEVSFNGVKSTTLLASSDTLVYATVPAGATTGPITVVNTAGSGTSAKSFVVGAGETPSLTSVSPTSAPRGGLVVLTGTNLAGCQVYFSGSQDYARVLSNSGTRIETLVPADATTGYVEVFNDIGDALAHFTIAEPPRIASVSPASGSTNGGTRVTVSGVNFEAGATVTIGGVPASGVTVKDTNTLTATTGPRASAGFVEVVVTNPTDLSGTLRDGFNYVKAAAPTVSAIAPNSGRTSGGTAITLTGTGFAAGATVKVGGAAATNVSLVDANTLTATTPAGTAGKADVVVTNPDGQSATVSQGFTYVPAPTLASVSPTSGSGNGGTQVTLTGTNFVAGATVSFGGTAATNVTVASATSITATTPAHAAGAVDVVVTNPDGQKATLANGFTFNPVAAPVVSGVNPNRGPSAGGTVVTLTGANFANGATVTIGGVAATNVVVSSTTSLTATTGGHAAGAVDVVVRNPDGQTGTLTGGFTYDPAPAPTVSAVSPSSGPSTGGTSITVTGTGFGAGATVVIGGTDATNVSVVNATTVTATTPAHAAGTVDVVVRNADGQSGTKAGGFTFNPAPAPTVSTVSPTSGPSTGGTVVTVSGSNFVSGATVTFGGSLATNVTVVNASTISATTPPHQAATVDVVVRNGDGQASTLTGGFTYNPAPAPTVSSVSPGNGPASGNTDVTITGSNFEAGVLVSFGGVRATNVTRLSANVLTVVTPAHAAGTVDVVVLNLDGQSATKQNGFTYDAPPAPVVGFANPNHGPSTGGTQVSISGSNFGVGAIVTFGGVTASGVTFVNANTLTATAPAHAAGVVDVVVRNADGQTGTLTGGYTYDVAPAPALSSVTPAKGSTNGGTAVTLSGANFAAGATVTFGGVAASNVSVASASSITVTTPAHAAGAVDVVVRNADGQVATLTGAFTYEAPVSPVTLTGISPSSGQTSGGTTITLTGNGFAQGATVTVGGLAATDVRVASETSLTAITPAHSSGAVDVVVSNPGGQSATLTRAFTYEQALPPFVGVVSPNTGPTAGGTSVTLTGANFVSGAKVRIGGVEASSVVVASPVSITAVTPPHAEGAVEVVVTNPDGQAGTLANGFTYTAPNNGGGNNGGGNGGNDGGGCSSTAGGPMSAAPVVLLGLALLMRRRSRNA